MTKAKHKQMLKEFTSNLDETIVEMLEDDNFASFTDIKYNKSLTEFDIYVDSELFSPWDSFATLGFYMFGGMYQAFSGVNQNKIDVVVRYIDADTKEVLESAKMSEIPDNLEEGNQTEEPTNNTAAKDAPYIEVGETVVHDDVSELIVESTNIAKKVMPPTPGSFYTYYEAENGKSYIDLSLVYKNLRTSEIMADEIARGTLWFAGKFQYPSRSIIEEKSRQDFTYANITSIKPLSTEYIHLLFQVPDDVIESEGKISLSINVDGNHYNILVRDGKEGDILKPYSDSTLKDSGSVKLGEKVAAKDKFEFWVDYSSITNKVEPSMPSDFHTYYEADDGKVYVDFCIAFKNWKPSAINADDVMKGKLIYADKYEYTGFSMVEEKGRSDFTYSNITSIQPLSVEYIHYLFEVPDEVANSADPIIIQFSINNQEYMFKAK